MNLSVWDPFRELEEISNRLNRAFSRSGSQLAKPTTKGEEAMALPDWSPAVDIVETPEEWIVKAEVPEVKRENIKVTFDDGILRIEGKRELEKEERNKKYHRIERYYGTFLRTYTLPDNVDETKAKANYADGMLTVRLPKSERAQPKSVEIKIGP